MSKTDRTDPYWVRAKNHPGDTEVSHACIDFPNDMTGWWSRHAPTEPCDLDTGPHTRCRRWFITDYYGSYMTVPRWFTDALWTSPDRSRARDECRDAMRDYNANGDTDVIVRTQNHRHNALWNWL